MLILGVDPGLRNTGVALVNERGTVTGHETWVCPGEGKQPTEEYLQYVVQCLHSFSKSLKLDYAAVEQVQWYGRRQNITLPLSHVAGAVTGYLLGRLIPVCLLPASMKAGVKMKQPAGWTDHEYDAALLAKKLLLGVTVEPADADYPKLETVRKRIIIVTNPAPGRALKRDGGGPKR